MLIRTFGLRGLSFISITVGALAFQACGNDGEPRGGDEDDGTDTGGRSSGGGTSGGGTSGGGTSGGSGGNGDSGGSTSGGRNGSETGGSEMGGMGGIGEGGAPGHRGQRCDAGSWDDDDDATTECVACTPGTYCPEGVNRHTQCGTYEDGSWDDDADPTTPCVPWTECEHGPTEPGTALADSHCWAGDGWELDWSISSDSFMGETVMFHPSDDLLVVGGHLEPSLSTELGYDPDDGAVVMRLASVDGSVTWSAELPPSPARCAALVAPDSDVVIACLESATEQQSANGVRMFLTKLDWASGSSSWITTRVGPTEFDDVAPILAFSTADEVTVQVGQEEPNAFALRFSLSDGSYLGDTTPTVLPPLLSDEQMDEALAFYEQRVQPTLDFTAKDALFCCNAAAPPVHIHETAVGDYVGFGTYLVEDAYFIESPNLYLFRFDTVMESESVLFADHVGGFASTIRAFDHDEIDRIAFSMDHKPLYFGEERYWSLDLRAPK